MTKLQTTIAVAGNATLDAIINGTSSVEKNDVTISSDNIVEVFHIEDPPIISGLKHQVNQNISQKVKKLWNRIIPGGGGYNSVTAMRNLSNIKAKLQLVYMDVSTPNSSIINSLKEHNIPSHFSFQYEMPVNAIVGLRNDRIVLKSPQLERVKPSATQIQEVKEFIKKSSSLLINSIKDPKHFECYLKIAQKYNIYVYAMLTTSLESQFVFKKVVPNVSSIFNYDELPKLRGIKEKMDEQSRMKLALETLKKIRKDRINTDKPMYVTLGKNGVYCAKKNSIIHIKLKPEYAEKIKPNDDLPAESIRGAGDVFAAAVTVHDTLTKHNMAIPDLLIKASAAAIRHIGYRGNLPTNAFLQKEYKI